MRLAFASTQIVYERGSVNVAHLNFVRILPRITASAPGGSPLMRYLEMKKLQEAE